MSIAGADAGAAGRSPNGLAAGARLNVGAGPVLGFLLAGYVLLLPVQLRLSGSFRVAPSDALLAVLLVVYVGTGRLRIPLRALSPWHFLVPMTFIVGTVVTALHDASVSRYTLVNKVVGLAILFLGYAVFSSIAVGWGRIRWLLRLLVVGVAVQALVAVIAFTVQRLGGPAVAGLNDYTGRVSGMLVDPNAFGGLLVLTMAILLAGNSGRRPLLGGWPGRLCATALVVGVILTFSRSAWLALAAVIGLVSLVDLRLALKAGAAGVLAVGAMLAVVGTQYIRVIVAMATRGAQIEARLEYIDVALHDFAASPILGTGLGYFADQYGWIIHNTPLWIMAEMGLVGLIVFTGFAAWFIWAGVSAYRAAPADERPIVLGLVLAFTAMCVLSVGIEALYQRHWWLVMSLIAAAHVLASPGPEARAA